MARNDDLAKEHANVTTLRKPRMFGDLQLKSIGDAENAPPREYIVKGLMGVGEMSVICGPPKCGKSFAAAHVAYAVSQGREVWGRRVKQRPVVYVALEGEGGFSKRLRALAQTNGASAAFYYIAQPVPLFDRPELAQDIIAAAKNVGAGLIVIDTHARAMTGGDENLAKDTGKLVGLYDEIRQATGAHVAVIHHTGKDAERGGRGSTALPAAADAWLAVAKDEAASTHALEVKLSKDDPSGDALNFKLAQIEVGTDSDGDPETTCIVEELDAVRIDGKAAKAPRLTAKERADLESVLALFNERPELVVQTAPAPGMPILGTVTREDLRVFLEDRGILLRNADRNADAESNRLRQQMQRMLTGLKTKGAIGFNRERVWLIDGGRYDGA